jgi:hypothetical protein
MSTKYLELDSNYRNRNLPGNEQPGSFSSQISQTGVGTQITAVDPVTYAYPVNVFRVSEATGTFNYKVPTGALGLADSSSNKFIVEATAATNVISQQESGYFNGAILQVGAGITYRIAEWTYLGTYGSPAAKDTFTVTTETFVPLTGDTTFSIYQPSSNTGSGWSTSPQYIFLPSSLSIPNYYSKYLLYNQTKQNSTTIVDFDRDTHLAKLGTDVKTTLGWTADGTDPLIIRTQLPRLLGDSTSPYELDPSLVTTTGLPGTIIGLKTTTGPGVDITTDSTFINNFLRFYETGGLDYTVNKITAVVLKVSPRNSSPPYYVIDNNGNGLAENTNQYTYAVNTSYCLIDVSSLHPAPTIGGNTRCEVMGFNVDNYSPFTYNGSLASQNQSVSYDVTLNSIVLPNVILSTGGRIAYYPYVYVEIENVSTTTGANKNMIYSNNPNAYRAIFKVPITDLNHPATTPFVKLTCGMTQTMTFKPNADMAVTVRLPGGSVFRPQADDTLYGQTPNTMLQLSMLFGLTRI